VGGEQPSIGAGRATTEDAAELALDDEDVEFEESEGNDPTDVSESRFRESSETAALGDIYQRVNQLVPVDQDLLTLEVGTSAVDGLRTLDEHRYSQAPVMNDQYCIGVFSYRSFARTVAYFPGGKSEVAQITVEDCIEKLPYVRLEDSIEDIFDALDQHNAVLVGEPTRLRAIASPMDALLYLYGIANGYVLIRQIELGLRHVIRLSTNPETLAKCIDAAVAQKYIQHDRDVPERLEEMEFADLSSILTSGRTWEPFAPFLGRNLDHVKSRLETPAPILNPLSTGECGGVETQILTSMFSSGTPSMSAATWAMIV
jgi:predicted transcriptional regulator